MAKKKPGPKAENKASAKPAKSVRAKPGRRKSQASKGSRQLAHFEWTPARDEAAELLAADVLSDRQIAEQVGVSRKSIHDWKQVPEFAAKVQEHAQKLIQRAREYGISSVLNRVALADQLRAGLVQTVMERAKDPEVASAPGGRTGLVVKQLKMIGFGENAEQVEQYSVDVAVIREIRALHQDVAKELGQLIDKVAPVSPDGQEQYGTVFTEEEKQQLLAALVARLGITDAAEVGEGRVFAPGSPLARLQAGDAGGGDGAGPVADPSAERLKPPSAHSVFKAER